MLKFTFGLQGVQRGTQDSQKTTNMWLVIEGNFRPHKTVDNTRNRRKVLQQDSDRQITEGFLFHSKSHLKI